MTRVRAAAGASRIRRIAGRALALLLLCGTTVLLSLAWQHVDVPIEVVEVSGELTGAERARAVEVVAAFLPAGLVSLDARALRSRLAAESWIDAAAVRRRWPDGLEIRIAPEVAVARWQGDALLSSRGAVIEPLEIIGVDALPHLAGPPGSAPEVMRVFQLVSDVLRPLDVEIEALEQDDVGDIRVRTRDGVRVLLGADRHVARLRRLVAVIDSELRDQMQDVASLDARYDNGIAVAWRDLPLEEAGSARLAGTQPLETDDSWRLQPER